MLKEQRMGESKKSVLIIKTLKSWEEQEVNDKER